MTRGTTPTNTFTVKGIDLTGAKIFLTYAQSGNTLFERSSDDLQVSAETIDDVATSTVVAVLTQEETLKLVTEVKVRIQLRAVFEDGTAVATGIVEKSVGEILKDGEISYD